MKSKITLGLVGVLLGWLVGFYYRRNQTLPPDQPELTNLADSISELQAMITRISAERNTMMVLLENMSNGIISTDAEGLVTNLNSAARRILNLADNTVWQKRPFVKVIRDHEINALLRQTLQDGQERIQVLEVGPRRPQLQVKISLITQDTHIRSGLVVLQDLTEVMRLERSRRDFVANISHELRTPLASVKLMVETLQNIIEDDPLEAQLFLSRIDTEVDGLTQLVRELLELSRIESGQVKFNFKFANLAELVGQAVERMTAQAERRGLTLTFEPPPEALPNALVDPDRLMQVLINLIHNAIKFTPVGGMIAVKSGRYEGKLVVQVKDSGVGIPPDDISRIFERFYKVDKARAGSESGTGLGLAISKHIVQAHGGEIWVESTVGVGSVFSFTIP